MITDNDNRVMVLMLTAAGTAGDRVSGLGLGADDYLSKPFHFAELVQTIPFRRTRPAHPLPRPPPALRAGPDPARGRDRARPAAAHRQPGRPPARPIRQMALGPGSAAARHAR